ncbi:MAG TPA: pilus assembly protein TadG-related protein [Candidatus Limnocylindrales bacterium]|nr:pilus assembly protein TadG-related protein [Candidatus Limnocylindrales bacterium]
MTTTGTRARLGHSDERGQSLVIFTLSLVVLIAIVGLVLDGGSAFAQRRDQQNAADLAALAGATAYLNTPGDATVKQAAADAAARSVAAANGYGGTGSTATVAVSFQTILGGANVRVEIGKPHPNNFVGLLGMPSWGIGVHAVAQASGSPNAATGPLPVLFNEDAFAPPNGPCDERARSCPDVVFQEPLPGSEDVPQDATQFNWTIFCTANGSPCNANSDGVRDLINGFGRSTVVTLDMDIGPLNAGSHTTLFAAMEQHIGKYFPVPVVNDEGEMVGWAYFKLTGVEGASEKVIRGYFVSPINATALTVVGNSTPSLATGAYVVKLID